MFIDNDLTHTRTADRERITCSFGVQEAILHINIRQLSRRVAQVKAVIKIDVYRSRCIKRNRHLNQVVVFREFKSSPRLRFNVQNRRIERNIAEARTIKVSINENVVCQQLASQCQMVSNRNLSRCNESSLNRVRSQE